MVVQKVYKTTVQEDISEGFFFSCVFNSLKVPPKCV